MIVKSHKNILEKNELYSCKEVCININTQQISYGISIENDDLHFYPSDYFSIYCNSLDDMIYEANENTIKLKEVST